MAGKRLRDLLHDGLDLRRLQNELMARLLSHWAVSISIHKYERDRAPVALAVIVEALGHLHALTKLELPLTPVHRAWKREPLDHFPDEAVVRPAYECLAQKSSDHVRDQPIDEEVHSDEGGEYAAGESSGPPNSQGGRCLLLRLHLRCPEGV